MSMIHLMSPGGVVIGFSEPLPEHISKQYQAGELTRVHADGTAWDEDTEPEVPAGETVPARPADSAPKRDWAAYAAAVGAVAADEAPGMTRAALIDACTPPELRPGDPGD